MLLTAAEDLLARLCGGFFLIAMCRHRVNVRHASNELNWQEQVEDNCTFGLNLKNLLVHKFNEEDVRTYRLCFAIKDPA